MPSRIPLLLAAATLCLSTAPARAQQRAEEWLDPAMYLPSGEPRPVGRINLAEALAGRHVSLVLVKDYARMANAGPAIGELDFQRYLPVIDDDQIVLGRWAVVSTDDAETFPISVVSSAPDPAGNLIQTYRIRNAPADAQFTAELTTLIARRERPLPAALPDRDTATVTAPSPGDSDGDAGPGAEAARAIPAPEEYPPEVRPYLRSTAMVLVDHPEIRAAADRLLAESRDPVEIAAAIARVARTRSYLPADGADHTLPTSVFVLRHGGSCCGSAVSAAAILRACGIPAQITYAPAGYIHGVTRFYLSGHGWVRLDATSGVGKFPLVQEPSDLGLVRLYDTPIEMEELWYAYAWPYMHNDLDGEYAFIADGEPTQLVRFASRDEREAAAAGRVAGWIRRPFPHLEPGSWNTVLGTVALDGPWTDWGALRDASREAAAGGRIGTFDAVTFAIPGIAPYLATAEATTRPARK